MSKSPNFKKVVTPVTNCKAQVIINPEQYNNNIQGLSLTDPQHPKNATIIINKPENTMAKGIMAPKSLVKYLNSE